MTTFVWLAMLTGLTVALDDCSDSAGPISAISANSEAADRDALPADQPTRFRVNEQPDRLTIILGERPITEFVFRDDEIHRPYFSNLKLPNGLQVTRRQPPVEALDPVDHATMHPGLWLGFGDVSGSDFWRNKAVMEHSGFQTPPVATGDRLTFACGSKLRSETGEPVCRLDHRIVLLDRPVGWMLIWEATFVAENRRIVLGDQEEMGFGARVATPFTEKNGGHLRSSTGLETATRTWGQPADWCDYSGTDGDRSGGIMLMSGPDNFRRSWWHNRDYGLFVANPFGREAMRQGEASRITIPQGETLRLVFGACVHEGLECNQDAEFQFFRTVSRAEPAPGPD